MKTFLICPVRGADQAFASSVVKRLEGDGWIVHFPPLDTDQDDETGLRICTDNRAAIDAADCVHVIWDGESQGCIFDLGMAFALGKPLHVVHLPEATAGKSFQNMARDWAQ